MGISGNRLEFEQTALRARVRMHCLEQDFRWLEIGGWGEGVYRDSGVRGDLLSHVRIWAYNIVIPEVDRRYGAGSPPVDQMPCQDQHFCYRQPCLVCNLDKSSSCEGRTA